MTYRAEIDGLRTIAVLGVVLFHLHLQGVSGGFLGVDIFFVISGYLITRNILGDIGQNCFSFSNFYARRARRILPALIFTVIATFLAGMLWLGPPALRQLAKESTHALLSIANIQYWREFKQYFSPASDELALLHCWSLSVEEQFYLIWPLFIFLAAKYVKPIIAIVAAGVISFCISLYWYRLDPTATFFLMPFRIFQFAIGASVIFVEMKIRRNRFFNESLMLSGLAAILFSFFFLTSKSPYAMVTLIPTIGAALVILAGSRAYSARPLMSLPFVVLGRASYSLYLCHWPMIVFAHVIFGDAANSPQAVIINFVLMIVVSLLMQRFVERRFRHAGEQIAGKSTLAKYATVIGALTVITHGTFLLGGQEWRLTTQARAQVALLRRASDICHRVPYLRCAFGNLDSPLSVELVGDSYSTQYRIGLDSLLKELHMHGENSETEGCPVLFGMPVPPKSLNRQSCEEHRKYELARLKESSTLIIMSHNWLTLSNEMLTSDPAFKIPEHGGPYSFTQKSLEETIKHLQKPGRKFLIVGAQIRADQCEFNMTQISPSPLPHAAPSPCPPKSRAQALEESEPIDNMLRDVQRKFPDQVELWLPIETFCDAECPTHHDDTLLYLNTGHFNVAGSFYAIERARSLLVKFLQ